MAHAIACAHHPIDPVPGDTEISVTRIVIRSATNTPLSVDRADMQAELLNKLGVRVGSRVLPKRRYNAFRVREDKRRIATFFQLRGYFDVEVGEPEVNYDAARNTAAITWSVVEGYQYRITDLHLKGVPDEHRAELRRLIPFSEGSTMRLDLFRPLRRVLAERLQDKGFGHARVYSRLYVSREHRTCEWYYHADLGPQTRIGSIAIEGNRRIPTGLIRRRLGLGHGEPFGPARRSQAEQDLLDTGSFSSVAILSDADVQTGPPEFPDTGGVIAAARIRPDGSLTPRPLKPTLNLRVRVVESPARQARVEFGVEADPYRFDSFVSTRLWLRDVFGPHHHLVAEGSAAYGLGFRDAALDGVYGHALLRYVRAGVFGRIGDLRMTARYQDILLPTARVREVHVGPGLRASLGAQRFLDIDVWFRLEQALNLGPFDDTARTNLALPADDEVRDALIRVSLLQDRRDNLLEPRTGYLWSIRVRAAPGGPLGQQRYLTLAPELRAYKPLSPSWSLAARASGSWVLGHDSSQGVSLGVRAFGGGPFGMRGFGRWRLSPRACTTATTMEGAPCDTELVGGLSLTQASLEVRYLPFRQLYGLAGFVDIGAASVESDPFARGVALAIGIGLRARSWYVPVSVDISYRLLDENALVGPFQLDPYQLFLRIGEAF